MVAFDIGFWFRLCLGLVILMFLVFVVYFAFVLWFMMHVVLLFASVDLWCVVFDVCVTV